MMSSPLKNPTPLAPLTSHIIKARSTQLPEPPPLPTKTATAAATSREGSRVAEKKASQNETKKSPDAPGRRLVRKKETADDVKVKVGMSLPVPAITRLRSAAAQQGIPQAEALLLAVDAYAQDPDPVEASNHRSTTSAGFIIDTSRPDEIRSVLAVRISKHNLERLDSLVSLLGAANRSDLVARSLMK